MDGLLLFQDQTLFDLAQVLRIIIIVIRWRRPSSRLVHPPCVVVIPKYQASIG